MSQLSSYLLVALGGAVGSTLRYTCSVYLGAGPATTLAVNISGSFLIGLLMAWFDAPDSPWRLLLGTGLMGGYTTFSTFEWEILSAVKEERIAFGALLAFASVAAGLAAVYGGYAFGKLLKTANVP